VTRLEDEESAWALKIGNCGAPLSLTCFCCMNQRTIERRCDLKWCPSCAPALVYRTVERYQAALAGVQWPLFVTLTTQNFKSGPDCVREVRRAFGKLRRLRWFKKCVAGGVAAVEVTNKGKGWHPHVHALMDCKWLAVSAMQPGPTASKQTWATRARAACAEVAEQWSLCLGGRKSSVRVRRVWKRDGGDIRPALAEVLKYSIDSENLLSIKAPLSPLIDVLSKTRLVTSWGNCFGTGIKRKKACAEPCEQCHSMDSWVPTEIIESDLSAMRRGRSTRIL